MPGTAVFIFRAGGALAYDIGNIWSSARLRQSQRGEAGAQQTSLIACPTLEYILL